MSKEKIVGSSAFELEPNIPSTAQFIITLEELEAIRENYDFETLNEILDVIALDRSWENADHVDIEIDSPIREIEQLKTEEAVPVEKTAPIPLTRVKKIQKENEQIGKIAPKNVLTIAKKEGKDINWEILDFDLEDLVETPKTPIAVIADIQMSAADVVTPEVPEVYDRDKGNLKRILLYKYLYYETYLLLSLGINIDPIISAVERFVQNHNEHLTTEQIAAMCKNVYSGLSLRLYSWIVNNEGSYGDVLDNYAREQKDFLELNAEKNQISLDEIVNKLRASMLFTSGVRKIRNSSEVLYMDLLDSIDFAMIIID
ncbi:hypothetical protein GF340_00465 [Candidatus Peregrinibacteria bacterium]|nr:hypothetical protein [Candidatus Peregrinibacteria bacterium]